MSEEVAELNRTDESTLHDTSRDYTPIAIAEQYCKYYSHTSQWLKLKEVEVILQNACTYEKRVRKRCSVLLYDLKQNLSV